MTTSGWRRPESGSGGEAGRRAEAGRVSTRREAQVVDVGGREHAGLQVDQHLAGGGALGVADGEVDPAGQPDLSPHRSAPTLLSATGRHDLLRGGQHSRNLATWSLASRNSSATSEGSACWEPLAEAAVGLRRRSMAPSTRVKRRRVARQVETELDRLVHDRAQALDGVHERARPPSAKHLAAVHLAELVLVPGTAAPAAGGRRAGRSGPRARRGARGGGGVEGAGVVIGPAELGEVPAARVSARGPVRGRVPCWVRGRARGRRPTRRRSVRQGCDTPDCCHWGWG